MASDVMKQKYSGVQDNLNEVVESLRTDWVYACHIVIHARADLLLDSFRFALGLASTPSQRGHLPLLVSSKAVQDATTRGGVVKRLCPRLVRNTH